MKEATEWLNEMAETVTNAMFSRVQPPGSEVVGLIKRIQGDAIVPLKNEIEEWELALSENSEYEGDEAPWDTMRNEFIKLRAAMERVRDAATTLIRYKNQPGQDDLWNNLANATNEISALIGSPGR